MNNNNKMSEWSDWKKMQLFVPSTVQYRRLFKKTNDYHTDNDIVNKQNRLGNGKSFGKMRVRMNENK